MVAVGEGVTEVRLGHRVAVENHFFCGLCYQCKVSLFVDWGEGGVI